MDSSKQKLRREMKKHRLAMTAEEVSAESRAISETLIATIDWAGVKNMHIYSAARQWNEVETKGVIGLVRRQWPQIELTIAVKSARQELPKRQFDLIIVPCLGFDKDLYRLGLGAGFYDRFLAGQPEAMKIGLAFASGLAKPGLPREPHDIPLDKIITEEGIMEAHDS